jgi:integrase/recombinase XerD
MWVAEKKGFKAWLQLEKSLSDHSVEAYLRDIEKLTQFLTLQQPSWPLEEIRLSHLQAFLKWIGGMGMTASSQSRIVSGIRSFFKYCLMENLVRQDPSILLETPRMRRTLPDFLSVEEINRIVAAIDLSKPEGERNRAILETLDSCGLRVSELVGLRISSLYPELGIIKVVGKGDKERLIPIGNTALKFIRLYRDQVRVHMPIRKGNEDILFLNRRGAGLSRQMIFYLIRELVVEAGITLLRLTLLRLTLLRLTLNA